MAALLRAGLAVACAMELVACGKTSREEASAASAAPSSSVSMAVASVAAPRPPVAKPFVPSFAVPPFRGAFPHPVDPTVTEDRRMVDVVYARPGADGDAPPVFTLTNRSGRKLRVEQAWIFTYDASGKELERSWYAGGLELERGASRESGLGPKTRDLKPGAARFEAEVTQAAFGDELWFNENLTGGLDGRPEGGLSPDALVAMAGERVIVDVYALASYRVRLTNVTNRPVVRLSVTLLYFDADGRVVRSVRSAYQKSEPPGWGGLQRVIEPGESLDVTLVPDPGPAVPPTAVDVVAYATRVSFLGVAGGSSAVFENRNLASEARRLHRHVDAGP